MSLKSHLRAIKRSVEKTFGTVTHELYWLMRSSSSAKRYLSEDSLNHPHRDVLIDVLKKGDVFNSLLEVGCASGPNIYRIATAFPHVKLFGTDINSSAIKVAKKWFSERKLDQVEFFQRKLDELKDFADNSVDIVLSDAALMYVGPDKIKQVMAELFRVTRNKVIFIERHSTETLHRYEDNWTHNYVELLRPFARKEQIVFTKITEDIWGGDWARDGYFIEVTVNQDT